MRTSAFTICGRATTTRSGRFTGVDPLSDQGQPRYEYAGADPVDGIDPLGTEDLIECALLGSNGLGTCSAPRLLAIHPPPLCDLFQDDPILSAAVGNAIPQCKCKKCFNTEAFAQYLNAHATFLETDPSPYHPSPKKTYCARIVREALQEGGADVPRGDAYTFANTLPGAGFKQVGSTIPQPDFHSQHYGQIGDVTVFGIAPGHKSGHVEGYTGVYSHSGWTSYWKQNFWTPYPPTSTPAGPAQIFRSKCPCGQ